MPAEFEKLERVKAWWCNDCGEVRMTYATDLWLECDCGSLLFNQNAKGRVYCSSCGRFAKRWPGKGCQACQDSSDSWDDLIGEASECEAVRCPDCESLLLAEPDELEWHYKNYHPAKELALA